jgi:hypothetical protein
MDRARTVVPYGRGRVKEREGKVEIPDEIFRFGLQFSDGARVTTLSWEPPPPNLTPEGPVMWPASGRGGGRCWDQGYWVWPLPPDGPLAFVCEWPAYGVALSKIEIDGGQILEAAARAEILWPEDLTGPRGRVFWSS